MPTNLYGSNMMTLTWKSNLGKCLEEQNFAVAREDLNKNLTENINGKSSATYGSNLKAIIYINVETEQDISMKKLLQHVKTAIVLMEISTL